MTTVAVIKNRVGRLLSDVDFNAYSEDLFYDGLSAALDAILPWVPKTANMAITGDGSADYDLPDDLYQVEVVVDDASGEILPHANLIPGYFVGENIEDVNDWIEYPHGSVSFSKEVSVGETYTLYYLAHWSKPSASDENDDLEAPEYTHLAVILYTTAYMLQPAAISASEVRQFNTRVDSGNPEHNPMQKTTAYLLKLFSEEMNRHPRHQKAQR